MQTLALELGQRTLERIIATLGLAEVTAGDAPFLKLVSPVFGNGRGWPMRIWRGRKFVEDVSISA